MTTSDFAPGLREDEHVKKFVPYRFDLMNGQRLRHWLINLPKPGPRDSPRHASV